MSVNKTEQDTKKVQEKDEKIDKYLTDMKELPPTSKDTPDDMKKTVGKKVESQESEEEKTTKKESQTKASETKPNLTRKEEHIKSAQESTLDAADDEVSSSIFTFKDVILGIINIISIALIIFLLFKLPQKAKDFQAERIEQIKNQVNPQNEFGNISDDSDKASKLDALFLDETGVVRFVSDVEKLKADYPAISKVTFASPKAIKDEMGLMGIPVTIELRGGWDTFKPALEKIQGLPYLFRPISVNAGPSKDDPSVLVLDYGVFLYVNSNTSN